MDYGRIYNEFIADRRQSERHLLSAAKYSERHHIVPKSRDGSDEEENLIALTAEDHFFAHLLLAKIYGGGMWSALCLMRWGRIGGERPWVRGRYMYGVARRRHAELASKRMKGQPGRRGVDNGMHDPTVYRWTNLDTGQKIDRTQQGMHQEFGGTRPHWTSALSGARKSMLGWTPRPEAIRVRGLKGKTSLFVNRDGRTFEGTQGEFCKMAGVSGATACRVVRDRSVTKSGWRHEGTWDRQPYCRKSDGLPARARAA